MLSRVLTIHLDPELLGAQERVDARVDIMKLIRRQIRRHDVDAVEVCSSPDEFFEFRTE
jgi:hypothetical protein